MSDAWLVVEARKPCPEYGWTWHRAGQVVVDELASHAGRGVQVARCS